MLAVLFGSIGSSGIGGSGSNKTKRGEYAYLGKGISFGLDISSLTPKKEEGANNNLRNSDRNDNRPRTIKIELILESQVQTQIGPLPEGLSND
jgi:hypothetical protein